MPKKEMAAATRWDGMLGLTPAFWESGRVLRQEICAEQK